MSIQDVNHLTISGHVNHPPQLRGDGDAIASCQFVLTHTGHSTSSDSEQQHYRVIAHETVAEAFAARYELGQMVIVMGRLDLEIQETLLGPLPAISITAHRVMPIDTPTNPSTASTASDPEHVRLSHTATRLVS